MPVNVSGRVCSTVALSTVEGDIRYAMQTSSEVLQVYIYM